MNGKISQFLLLALLLILFWQWLGPARRRELHRSSKIAALVLLGSATIALILHWRQ
ncbi:hypothetical protein HQ393_14915 [Chitinibacter bivalviorum]|uniref:Uncharacterized protein n=1 Tax=Chitinibacter bivalviorum TaxID=2739434 RepID=A0A7H9BL77_9NEIS|nr:hypothetical protein [Chitinibacter bivalviorum]QLG89430.1 hypothetical protein HQ393_14915 [Chitinibacter bivalviorum]